MLALILNSLPLSKIVLNVFMFVLNLKSKKYVLSQVTFRKNRSGR